MKSSESDLWEDRKLYLGDIEELEEDIIQTDDESLKEKIKHRIEIKELW